VRTLQHDDALRKRREFCQPQPTEIEFSVEAVANAFKSDFHGWLGVRVCLFLIHLISIFSKIKRMLLFYSSCELFFLGTFSKSAKSYYMTLYGNFF
jgi:hypothetical protein